MKRERDEWMAYALALRKEAESHVSTADATARAAVAATQSKMNGALSFVSSKVMEWNATHASLPGARTWPRSPRTHTFVIWPVET